MLIHKGLIADNEQTHYLCDYKVGEYYFKQIYEINGNDYIVTCIDKTYKPKKNKIADYIKNLRSIAGKYMLFYFVDPM